MRIKIRVIDTRVGELGNHQLVEGENGEVASVLLRDLLRQSAAMGIKEIDILVVVDRNGGNGNNGEEV